MTSDGDEAGLLGAFLMGWQAALEAYDVDPLGGKLHRAERLVRAIAEGRLTLLDNPNEVARELRERPGGSELFGDAVADSVRANMPANIARDREMARRILAAMEARRIA